MFADDDVSMISSTSSRMSFNATNIPLSSITKHMESILLLGMATGTRKLYTHACNKFDDFINAWGLHMQTFDKQLTLFISFMSISDFSPSTIATYVSTIKGY